MRIHQIFCIILCGAAFSSFAQSYFPEKAKIINKSHGLSNDFVSEIFEDSKGYIWIGTQNGLCRYDGYEFQIFRFDAQDSFSLPQNWVVEIDEDRNGNIWIAMLRGLAMLDIKTLKFRPIPLATHHGEINFITELLIDDQDHIWLNTKEGIYSTITNTPYFELLYPDEQNRPIKLNGQVLVKTGTKVDLWDTKTKSKKSLNFDDWYAHHTESEKNMKPVDYLSIKESNSLLKNNFLHYDLSYQWLETRTKSHTIYYTRKEIWIQDPYQKHVKLFSMPQLFGTENNNLINTVLIDKNQNLWIGTEYGIVSIPFQLEAFKKFSPHHARKMVCTENALWIGGSQGLYEYSIDGVLKKKWLDKRVNAFDIQNDRVVVAVAPAQFITINNQTNKIVSHTIKNHGTELSNVFFIKILGNQIILGGQPFLLSTDFDFLHKSYLHPFDTIQSNADIISGFANTNNEFWIGTLNKGIYQFKKENTSWKLTDHININTHGFNNNTPEAVFHMTADKVGKILISTETGHVLYDPINKKVISGNAFNRLQEDKIMASQVDINNNYWISTIGNGLIFQNTTTYETAYFSESQGLPSNNFLFGSAVHGLDNYLYFGTDHGVIKFNPKDFLNQSKEVEDSLVLSSFYIQDKPFHLITNDSIKNISYKSHIDLSHRQNRLQLYFSKPSISKYSEQEYSYQLFPLEKEWRHWKKGDKIVYDRIPPGKYQLRWKKNNRVHVAITVFIHPPLYKTIPFIFTVLALLSTLAVWGIKKIIKYRLTKQKVLHDQEILKERSKYLSNLAHEIKTPLQLIQGPLKMIKQNTSIFPYQSSVYELIQVAESQTMRIQSLVKQMELLEKIDSASLIKDLAKLPVNLFIKTLVQTFDYRFNSHTIPIQLQSTIPEDLNLLIDTSHFTSIIYNLVQNVYDHAKGATHIVINLSFDLSILYITVSDDGAGVPAQNISRLFDRFYTQSDKIESTGLGLALVKELIEAYRGSIQYIPNIPQGSVFEIKIPLQEPLTNEPQSNCTEDIQSGRIEIVIVEDDQQMAKYLQSVLISNYQVKTFQSPRIALDYISAQLPDLIITDRMMPEMDGILLAAMIKTNSITSHMPIIMMSGKDDTESKLLAYQSNIDIFLSKPFSENELHRIIHQILANRKKLKESIQSQLAQGAIQEEDVHPFIKNLSDLIENEMSGGDLNVEIVSHKMMMSRTQLFRKCIVHFGISLQDIIDQSRITRAKRLITHTNDTIKMIAGACGFTDANYFAKFFKKETGMTALEYRKSKLELKLGQKQ